MPLAQVAGSMEHCHEFVAGITFGDPKNDSPSRQISDLLLANLRRIGHYFDELQTAGEIRQRLGVGRASGRPLSSWRQTSTSSTNSACWTSNCIAGSSPAQRLPMPLAHLVEPAGLEAARRFIEEEFACQLTDRIDVVAHKLLPGQRIAIHNDHLVGEETHRLTVQLNRGLSDEDGGFFMLFNSRDAADVHGVLRPASNTAIAFEISTESHHAVSRLHGGERYTLVYSFHAHRSDV
jgi:hypothetical protein